jgi:hypothetical protein
MTQRLQALAFLERQGFGKAAGAHGNSRKTECPERTPGIAM